MATSEQSMKSEVCVALAAQSSPRPLTYILRGRLPAHLEKRLSESTVVQCEHGRVWERWDCFGLPVHLQPEASADQGDTRTWG